MRGVPVATGRPSAAVLTDVALAAASVAWAVALAQEITGDAAQFVRVAAVVVAGIHGGCLLLRRHLPEAVVAVLLITAVLFRLLGLPPWFLGPAMLVGLYGLAVRVPRRRSLAWLAAAVVALVVTSAGVFPGWDSLVLFATLAAGAWLLGDGSRRRQAEAARHAERARQLERAREELAQFAVTQERLRIARELHDIVAHSMSVVVLNAGAARLAATTDPASAVDALATIEQTSRTALVELRQVLQVLRDDGGSPVTPLPGLAELPLLVAGVADAGLTVEVKISGEQYGLPGGVDLTAYRVIQEALTNTLKHSAARSAAVEVRYEPGVVHIAVGDPGPSRDGAADQGGSGLVGMRERVALYGGSLHAEADSGGGFTIAAAIPVGES